MQKSNRRFGVCLAVAVIVLLVSLARYGNPRFSREVWAGPQRPLLMRVHRWTQKKYPSLKKRVKRRAKRHWMWLKDGVWGAP